MAAQSAQVALKKDEPDTARNSGPYPSERLSRHTSVDLNYSFRSSCRDADVVRAFEGGGIIDVAIRSIMFSNTP